MNNHVWSYIQRIWSVVESWELVPVDRAGPKAMKNGLVDVPRYFLIWSCDFLSLWEGCGWEGVWTGGG